MHYFTFFIKQQFCYKTSLFLDSGTEMIIGMSILAVVVGVLTIALIIFVRKRCRESTSDKTPKSEPSNRTELSNIQPSRSSNVSSDEYDVVFSPPSNTGQYEVIDNLRLSPHEQIYAGVNNYENLT